MKAALLEEINGPLVIGEVGLTDLKFGQVLVKVLVSGICGSQLQEIAGNKGNAKFVPHLMGHEGCGIVEKVGVGVSRVKPGDKVVMHWRKGEGIESDFPTYIYKGKEIRSGKVTTFSEYSIVSENRLTAVPQDTPEDLCALLGCGLSTALGTINDEAQVKFGESVMIVGTGGLGVNLIKAAALASAYPIIAVDVHDNKKEVALSMGAHLFINAAKESVAEALQKFGVPKVEVIIETSGNKRAIEESLPLLAGSGRFINVGQAKPGETIELTNALHMFEGEGKTIKATQGGGFMPSRDIPRYTKLHKAGTLSTEGIITHRMRLEEVNEAIALVRAGQASRILIDMSRSAPQPGLFEAYKKMLGIRVAEQEIANLYLKEKIMSFVHFYVGQEAVAVGVCDSLIPQDRVMGNHRSHGHYLAKGGDRRAMICELLGKAAGSSRGKGGSMHMIDKSVNFVGSTPILGSVVPLATGSAFEQKYSNKDGLTVVFYGDGASEEGVVYESMNLAALFKLPILFVVENNLYAVNSKLRDRRGPNYNPATIAQGIGLAYQKADGNTYADVRAKAGALVAGIRAGNGPAVLECVAFRHMAHSAPIMDDAQGYREEDMLERRLAEDPLKKVKAELVAGGTSVEELDALEATLRQEVLADIAFAVAAPQPAVDTLYTDLYA